MIKVDETILTEAKNSLLDLDDFKGVQTGFTMLDILAGGFENGHLIIMGARPAMGKTTFAFSLIENICIKGRKSCLYYPAQMSVNESLKRIVALHAGVNYRVKEKDANYKDSILHAAVDVKSANLWIEDTRIDKAEEVIVRWRELGQQERIDIIIIDYLQLLESDTLDMGGILGRLKELAMELDCPVFILSQLTRSVEQRKYHQPRVSDLPDAKIIDGIADDIMFLLRPEYYDVKADISYASIIIGKHKNLTGHSLSCHFDPDIPVFMSSECL